MDKIAPTGITNGQIAQLQENNVPEAIQESAAQLPQQPITAPQLQEAPPAVTQLEKTPTADTLELNNAQNVSQEVEALKNQATTGKKWGVGIASGLIPGLGQAINGQWGKAAGFLAGALAASFVPKNLVVKGIAGLAVGIWSIVDAVKNAKSKPKAE